MTDNFNPGFLKLFYTLRDWEHFNNPNVLALWIHILLRARWQKKPGRHKGVELKRGQLVMCRKEMATSTGLTERQVRTALKTLETSNEVTTKATSKGTIITVVNYTRFQDTFVKTTNEPTNEPTSDVATERPAGDQQTTSERPLNNNINNYYNNNNARAREEEPEDMSEGKRRILREDAKRRGLNMEMYDTLKNPEWA